MKTLAVFVLFAVFASAWAAGPDAKHGEEFQKHKQMMVQELDEQISGLQATKACLSSAQDPEAVKRCHEEREKKMQQLRAQHAEKRKQAIDEQIKRLQEEKAKIGEKKDR